MLPIAVTILFVICALVTSALAYDERRWRYPFLIMSVCAGLLTIWSAQGLRKILLKFDYPLHPAIAIIAVALPFCFVIGSLMARRRSTPRHTPSINDDPTLRRHLEEKTRRARKRRQDEEALENSDVPSL